MTAVAVGVMLGVALCVLVEHSALRQRAWAWPTVLTIVAALYVVFAVVGGDLRHVFLETGVALGFGLVAWWGSPVWLATGFAVHGLYDLIRPALADTHAIPFFWPGFCLGVDFVIALWLWDRYSGGQKS